MAQSNLERTPVLSGYQLRLPTYEGPLDVLLRLIERNQLAIGDVSLVKVTDQFIVFIDELIDAPPEIVADFTAVGARLTVLKSRSLLPRPVAAEAEFEPSDLTVQLKEYKRIKDLARQLGEVHAAGLHVYTSASRGAIVPPGAGQPTILARHEPEQLMQILRRRLRMAPKAAQLIKQRRIISLRDVVGRVSELVNRTREVRFSTVVKGYQTRTEVSTAFLAVLILVRRQSIDASQSSLFGDISLEPSSQSGTRDHQNGKLDEDFAFHCRKMTNNDPLRNTHD